MKSIWETEVLIPARPALEEDIEVDAAVIGGGLSGILTAYFLTKAGLNTAVFEARRIGSGQSGRTTAKITVQHGTAYSRINDIYGLKAAEDYGRIQTAALEKYKELIAQEQIDCHFEERPSWIFSKRGAGEIKREAQCASAIGLGGEYLAAAPLPFETKGAFCLEGQAQFNPLEFLRALSEKVTVYENTRITDIKKYELFSNSLRIKAKFTVHASHFTAVKIPGFYFAKMHQERSCIAALENAPALGGMFLCTDPENVISLRNYGSLLLYGGSPYRTGKNDGGAYGALKRDAKKYFPESSPAALWSAQDGMTADLIPFFGRFSKTWGNHFTACGFGKWGMTNSMAAAMKISSLILGAEEKRSDITSPSRRMTARFAGGVLSNGAYAAAGLGRSFFAFPSAKLDNIPNGGGGIIMHGGKKTGVYKNERGEAFFVEPRCAHMGCELTWNQEELTWDCPCHGSRYDYRGRVLDSPADREIGRESEKA